MLLGRPGKHQDVVEVYDDKGVQEVSQHVVDQGLENSRGVSQTERHDEVLKVSQVSIKPPSSIHPPLGYVPDGMHCAGRAW